MINKTPIQVQAIALAIQFVYVMLYGGSRSGKTFIILYIIFVRAWKAPGSRHVIFRKHFNACKISIWKDTLPKMIRIADPINAMNKKTYNWNNTDFYITLQNGSEIWIAGLDDKERVEKVLGREFSTMYYNESSEMSWDSVETTFSRNAQLVYQEDGAQLMNKFFFDCNPPSKRHWSYTLFMLGLNPQDLKKVPNFEEYYGSIIMNPSDNAVNLPASYFTQVLAQMSKRKRDRFEKGLFADDAEGALFRGKDIDRRRLQSIPFQLDTVVIGVDPHVTDPDLHDKPETLDETGIIPVGRAEGTVCGVSGTHYFIFGDYTTEKGPHKWAAAACQAYEDNEANKIVAEINNGGDLVRLTIQSHDPNVYVDTVHASRGKAIRAEPVVLLMEQGRLHIIGELPELEGEMTGWIPGISEESPNRLDAMVWGVIACMQDRRSVVGAPQDVR